MASRFLTPPICRDHEQERAYEFLAIDSDEDIENEDAIEYKDDTDGQSCPNHNCI